MTAGVRLGAITLTALMPFWAAAEPPAREVSGAAKISAGLSVLRELRSSSSDELLLAVVAPLTGDPAAMPEIKFGYTVKEGSLADFYSTDDCAGGVVTINRNLRGASEKFVAVAALHETIHYVQRCRHGEPYSMESEFEAFYATLVVWEALGLPWTEDNDDEYEGGTMWRLWRRLRAGLDGFESGLQEIYGLSDLDGRISRRRRELKFRNSQKVRFETKLERARGGGDISEIASYVSAVARESRKAGKLRREIAAAERAKARWQLRRGALARWHQREYRFEEWPLASFPRSVALADIPLFPDAFHAAASRSAF